MLSLTPSGCPTTYTVTDTNAERTVMSSDMIYIDSTVTTYKLLALFRTVQNRFYYVRAVVKNNNQDTVVLVNEAQYWVSVTDPCLNAN